MKTRNDSPFVFGNLKLPKTTAVLNICPAHLCPSRLLGLCQVESPEKGCYAMREERIYPECIPSRLKMQEYWDRNTPWTIAEDLLSLNETKRTKVTALRINECGDFRHQADLEKAENLAHYLAKKGIKTYCYTARKDLDYADFAGDLTINGSGWMAHNRFQIACMLNTDTRVAYYGGKPTEYDIQVPYDAKCPGDCRKCSLCLEKAGRTIAVLAH